MRLTQYINEVRIGEACDLPMADPGCSLEELSEQVGIRNHPYFFKLFKNTTGMTPRDFCDRMIAVYGKKPGKNGRSFSAKRKENWMKFMICW